MACCVLAALIISQVVLAWEKCRGWLGLEPSGGGRVAAADWRPGLAATPAAAFPAAAGRIAPPFRRRLALLLSLQLSLGALLGLHWTHLGAEVRGVGAWLGVVAPASDPALCNVSGAPAPRSLVPTPGVRSAP